MKAGEKFMSTVKVHDLAYVRVRVPDLDRAEAFLTDFGLVRSARTDDALYMRGSGPSRHVLVVERGADKFLSLAFGVATASDLEAACSIAGASAIEQICEPGGGKRIWLKDPDGNGVELVWGIEDLPTIELQRHQLNDASAGLRRTGALMRHERGPAKVARLGHGVLMSTKPKPVVEWYQRHLGLLCSDEVVQDGETGLSFNRLDRGKDYVDHHVLLIQHGQNVGLNHIGFEVQDVDDVMLGHEHMKRMGHDSVWGIGRHVFGSQIFSYWMDPWGFMYEMWTDSDRLNAEFVGKLDATVEEADGPWGMDVPDRFFTHSHE